VLKSMGCAGESHHWTGTSRVVVDLGHGPDSGGAAATFRPDVTVLTHSDSDHIGGADDFFRGIRRHPGGELWLPYEWSVLIDVAERISAGAVAVPQIPVDAGAVEVVIDLARVVGAEDDPAAQRGGPVRDGTDDGIRIDRDRIGDALAGVFIPPVYLDEEQWGGGEGFLREALAKDDLDGIAADIALKATKLAAIVTGARRAGMTVRWFSVDHLTLDGREKWQVSGRAPQVSLVNAVEVRVGRVSAGWETAVLLAAMRLSVQNRRALATLLWPTDDAAGFLVWSDGDGTGCRLDALPWDRLGGMTAPHHGSDNDEHDPIWQAAAPHLAGLEVVLAGGAWNQGLHRAFTAHATSARACTSCGRCRAAQRRPGIRVHSAQHAAVTWPQLADVCAVACACAHHR